MTILEVLILSFVEGLTEFLPVSSTGHLIITSALMGIGEDSFVKSFNIMIQSGAILAVLVLYWRRFLPNYDFYRRVFIAFLPAAVIGLMVKDKIDAILGSVLIVAVSLVVGGVILILTDRPSFAASRPKRSIDTMDWKTCLTLGLIQCFAFIPGVSRSASTILGGLYLGLSRKEAAEFSFFLAVPTLLGASAIKGLKILPGMTADQWQVLGLGFFFSFLFALAAIRFFMSLIQRYGFSQFGWYRILVGGILLAMIYGGYL